MTSGVFNEWAKASSFARVNVSSDPDPPVMSASSGHNHRCPESPWGDRLIGMEGDGRDGAIRSLGRVVVTAGKDWLDDKAPRLAAALSYYTAFSLPPLLVLLVGIGGLVYGTDVVQERLMNQIGQLLGDSSALLLDQAISQAQTTGTG